MAHLVCGLKGSICVFSNLKIKIEGKNKFKVRAFTSVRRAADWNQHIMVVEGQKRINCILRICKIAKGSLHVPFAA
jgi:hypothetical protein